MTYGAIEGSRASGNPVQLFKFKYGDPAISTPTPITPTRSSQRRHLCAGADRRGNSTPTARSTVGDQDQHRHRHAIAEIFRVYPTRLRRQPDHPARPHRRSGQRIPRDLGRAHGGARAATGRGGAFGRAGLDLDAPARCSAATTSTAARTRSTGAKASVTPTRRARRSERHRRIGRRGDGHADGRMERRFARPSSSAGCSNG
jgi:hypothetical protein